MPTITPGEFYLVWPRFGKLLSSQWGESRTNHRNLHPLAVNEFIDETDANVRSALAGLAIGEQSFRTRWRTFYDQDADSYKIQYNSGTVAVPVWVDHITIKDSNGMVVIGAGGLDSSAGGFYGIAPTRELAVIGETGTGSNTDYLNKSKLFFNVESGFYLSGVAGGADSGGAVVNIDPVFQFRDAIKTIESDVLHFNSNHFYLTAAGTEGQPVVNLDPSAPGRFGSRQGVIQKSYELSGATLTLDFTASNVHEVVLNQNVTSVVITNTGNVPATHVVKFTQDAIGSRTVAGWDAAVTWPAGTAPTITATASAVDVLSFFADSEGNVYGNFSQDFS